MSYSSRIDENRAMYSRITRAFKDIGITSQVEIAKSLNLTKQKVQDWKSGKASARKYLPQISQATGKSIDWFYAVDSQDEDVAKDNVVDFAPKEEAKSRGRDTEFEAKLLKRLHDKLKTAPPEQRDFIHKVIKMLLGNAQDKAVD